MATATLPHVLAVIIRQIAEALATAHWIALVVFHPATAILFVMTLASVLDLGESAPTTVVVVVAQQNGHESEDNATTYFTNKTCRSL
jgi:hypothetical protein